MLEHSPQWTIAAALVIAAASPTSDVGHTDGLLLEQLQPMKGGRLTVTSPAFNDGAAIPIENTQYRDNLFPGLSWTQGPAATRSYVVVMQGESSSGSLTSIHFTLYNISAGLTSLAAGMTAPTPGASFGPNVHGLNQPYAGPHAHTSSRQRYHLQVVALDTRLQAAPDLTFEALETAMRGHVLASGELVGWSARDPSRAPRSLVSLIWMRNVPSLQSNL